MTNKALLAVLLLSALLPSSAFAAQFAKHSLYLSKSSVTEGDTVLIHAVVSNDSSGKFSGTLELTDGLNAIGSVPVSLVAGESLVVSVSWKPPAGEHPISGALKDNSGAVVETQKETFNINSKPKVANIATSSQSAAAVESSQNIQHSIEQVSPQAAEYTAPVFTLIDSGREKVADAIDSQLSSTKSKLGPNAGAPGEVLGAEATKNATQNPAGAFTYILQTLYFYLLTILRFIIGTAGVFYPLIALLFFYVLYRTYRRFRRPSY